MTRTEFDALPRADAYQVGDNVLVWAGEGRSPIPGVIMDLEPKSNDHPQEYGVEHTDRLPSAKTARMIRYRP